MEDKLDNWVTMENYGIGEKLDEQKRREEKKNKIKLDNLLSKKVLDAQKK
jgi:hypothetical protein